MKRLRLGRWSGQLPSAWPCRTSTSTSFLATLPRATCAESSVQSWTCQSQARHQSSAAASPELSFEEEEPTLPPPQTYPSPLPERALSSAKLAALHARLSLPKKIPLQTLARALVDPSADPDPRFNNSNLAFLGSTLLNYHATEWLVCNYPRLPFMVLTEASRAFAGPASLAQVSRSWGVESVAEPGDEVDPGLLQFSVTRERPVLRRWGVERPEVNDPRNRHWRRGINSRVVWDDDFGDTLPPAEESEAGVSFEGAEDGEAAARQAELAAAAEERPAIKPTWHEKRDIAQEAHADLVRAVVGATYAHCGREAAHAFIKAHVLSRQLKLPSLFAFETPTRELARLCAREGFEHPVARMLSETGRLSIRPVFVVGIYSGNDKLGEGAGPNPNDARTSAAMNALKAWYLYSPGPQTRVPSEMLVEGAKRWEPLYVDIGEVI